MKNLIILLALLFSINIEAGIILVSDLDDTIKITNSANETEAGRRAILSHDVFTGIPQFLKAARSYVSEVHVLSASSLLLRPKIQTTFIKKGITVDSIILKGPFQRQSNTEFKIAQLKILIDKNQSDDFILIGDDVENDPEIYDEMIKLYPNRILASYIHVVKKRDLPDSATKWWTAYDLYLREYLAKRMVHSEVAQIGDHLFGEFRMNLIIPDFADCPKTPNVWLWQMRSLFAIDAAALMAKLNLYCAARQSTIY